MKKLIRNKATRKFLTAEGDWTDDFFKALELTASFQTAELKRRFDIKEELEVYYWFEDCHTSQWDFALPLH